MKNHEKWQIPLLILSNNRVSLLILIDLGLSIYDWPKKVMFVEGKTDTLFFNQILKDIRIIPLHGPSIPKGLQEVISTFPLSRYKECFIVVDKNSRAQIEEEIANFDKEKIMIDLNDIGHNSLEEFIFDVNLETDEPELAWQKICKGIEKINKNLLYLKMCFHRFSL